MAGKSNKSKAKRAAQSSATNSSTVSALQSDSPAAPTPAPAPDNGAAADNAVEASVPETNEVPPTVPKVDESESQEASNDAQPKQG